MITYTIKNSKAVNGVYYRTSKISHNRWVTVTYQGNILYQTPRPVKVSKYIKRIESEIEAFKEIIFRAYDGRDYSRAESDALFRLFLDAMENI